MNIGLGGKGNALAPRCPARADRRRRLRAQAHEDWGHDPRRHRLLPLGSPTRWDIQVMIHTDTLNESGFVENTRGGHEGRTIHAFHTGGGRGRRPCARHHQGSAGSPTSLALLHQPPPGPFTVNIDRRASRHARGVPPPVEIHPEDVAFAESPYPGARPSPPRTFPPRHGRPSRSSASDSQAMGRVGESDHPHLGKTARTRMMKAARSPLWPEETGGQTTNCAPPGDIREISRSPVRWPHGGGPRDRSHRGGAKRAAISCSGRPPSSGWKPRGWC